MANAIGAGVAPDGGALPLRQGEGRKGSGDDAAGGDGAAGLVPALVDGSARAVVPMLGSSSAPDEGHRPIVRIRQGTSSNWSGYAAYGAAGRFTSVASTWTQPAVSCTAQNRYSSYWVGLDGYNTSTVEQLGTEGDCINGAARYYAWLEMYPRPGSVIGVTVTPSHSYSASVTTLRRGSFALRLTDVTTGQSFSTVEKLNSAQGASAEVVVEAPSNGGGILPLANFGTASFTTSTANGLPLGSFTPNLDPITMLNPYGMKSTPSRFDATNKNFQVTWSAS